MTTLHGSNTLICEFNCPHCQAQITTGIGFRAGIVNNISYKIGEKISWQRSSNIATTTWPAERPENGCFKTIGYFECENLRCKTWNDCFPQVQEMLISIVQDEIVSIKPVFYQPDTVDFAILSPDKEF